MKTVLVLHFMPKFSSSKMAPCNLLVLGAISNLAAVMSQNCYYSISLIFDVEFLFEDAYANKEVLLATSVKFKICIAVSWY